MLYLCLNCFYFFEGNSMRCDKCLRTDGIVLAEQTTIINENLPLYHLYLIARSMLSQYIACPIVINTKINKFADKILLSADSGENCTICLAEMKAAQSILKLNCKHYFHEECLMKWKATNNSCPCCRGDICHRGIMTAYSYYKMILDYYYPDDLSTFDNENNNDYYSAIMPPVMANELDWDESAEAPIAWLPGVLDDTLEVVAQENGYTALALTGMRKVMQFFMRFWQTLKAKYWSKL